MISLESYYYSYKLIIKYQKEFSFIRWHQTINESMIDKRKRRINTQYRVC